MKRLHERLVERDGRRARGERREPGLTRCDYCSLYYTSRYVGTVCPDKECDGRLRRAGNPLGGAVKCERCERTDGLHYTGPVADAENGPHPSDVEDGGQPAWLCDAEHYGEAMLAPCEHGVSGTFPCAECVAEYYHGAPSGPPSLYALTLDTVEPGAADFERALSELGIDAKLIQESGGNGWPVIRYVGTRSALEDLLERFFDEDAEFFDAHAEEADAAEVAF